MEGERRGDVTWTKNQSRAVPGCWHPHPSVPFSSSFFLGQNLDAGQEIGITPTFYVCSSQQPAFLGHLITAIGWRTRCCLVRVNGSCVKQCVESVPSQSQVVLSNVATCECSPPQALPAASSKLLVLLGSPGALRALPAHPLCLVFTGECDSASTGAVSRKDREPVLCWVFLVCVLLTLPLSSLRAVR